MKDRLINNIGLKVISLLFAVVMWALVVNIDDPVDEQTYRSIPVKVLHEEIFTAKASTYRIVDGKDTVNVTVRAKRSVLAQIEDGDIRVTADVKNRVTHSLSEATLPTEVVIKGFEGEYVEAYTTPQNLQIEVEPSTTKKFPISIETIGTPRDGNILGELKADPEKIMLGGGESQVNRVKKVVAKADVSGISKSGVVEAELILYDSNGKTIDPALFENNLGTEGLKVEVQVMKTKTVPVEFNTSKISPAAGYTLAGVIFEPKTIVVAGNGDALKELEKIEIPASALEINGIKENKEKKVEVSEYLPNGIRLADSTAGTIVVTISIEEFGTKTFSIPSNNIILENALAGLKPSVAMVGNIDIRVRGSKADLGLLTEAPKVYVDLEKYTTPGIVNVPVQAELPRGCTLVGSVTLQVTLEKQEQTYD